MFQGYPSPCSNDSDALVIAQTSLQLSFWAEVAKRDDVGFISHHQSAVEWYWDRIPAVELSVVASIRVVVPQQLQ